MKPIAQYSVVRITSLHREFDQTNLSCDSNQRLPCVGDEATIVEVYQSPSLAYELECNCSDGTHNWLITFSPEDAEFELVWSPQD